MFSINTNNVYNVILIYISCIRWDENNNMYIENILKYLSYKMLLKSRHKRIILN